MANYARLIIVVARAWQILGDAGLKEQFDSAPEADPTSRQSQMGGQQFRGAAGGEMTPEQLFEMFFNGGFNNGGPFGGGFGGSPGKLSSHEHAAPRF